MLLSIVESGNYLQYDRGKGSNFAIEDQGDMEIIGPVIGPNVVFMRNEGARLARGRWIFFKDQDCQIDPQKIYAFARAMELESDLWGAVGGFYHSGQSGSLKRAYHWIQRKWVHRGLLDSRKDGIRLGQHLLGGALMVNRKAFLKVGGFNNHIGWGGEEIDLVQKLLRGGFLTGVSPRIRVFHDNKIGFWGLCKRAWFQNFHRIFFSLHDLDFLEPRVRSPYIKAPLMILPWVGLFFSIAVLAGLCGRVMKTLSFLYWREKWIF